MHQASWRQTKDRGNHPEKQMEDKPVKKFTSPEQPPEGLDRELLTIMVEECNEIAQRGTKALRFGVMEIQPGQELTNEQSIARELGDLVATVERLQERGLISTDDIEAGRQAKHRKLDVFLQSDQ